MLRRRANIFCILVVAMLLLLSVGSKFGEVLLFVLIAGHFPYSSVPTEQPDLDCIVDSISATDAAKALVPLPRVTNRSAITVL